MFGVDCELLCFKLQAFFLIQKREARIMRYRIDKICVSSYWYFFLYAKCFENVACVHILNDFQLKEKNVLFICKFTIYSESACFCTKKILSL